MTNEILRFGKRALKSSAAPLSRALDARRWLSNFDGAEAGQVAIFGYHRVVPGIEQAEREAVYGLVTSSETFRRHLQLVRERYEVLSLSEAAAVLRGERQTARAAAVVTFDDGYRDVYDHALPGLKEFGIPATVFVSTSYIGSGQILDHDRLYWLILKARAHRVGIHSPLVKAGLTPKQARTICTEVDSFRLLEHLVHLPLGIRAEILERLKEFLVERPDEYPAGFQLLDWAMVREMVRAGISFGAHTDRHAVLTLEDERTIEREVLQSKQTLEAQLGVEAPHFAYPNGEHNDTIKKIVKRAGFDLAVTTERRVNRRGEDMFALGRFGLCEESTRGVTGRYSETVARLRLSA